MDQSARFGKLFTVDGHNSSTLLRRFVGYTDNRYSRHRTDRIHPHVVIYISSGRWRTISDLHYLYDGLDHVCWVGGICVDTGA